MISCRDGSAAIFKLAVPHEGTAYGIETRLHADGRGYVRLLRPDVGRQAMLQERLGVALADLGMPVMAQVAAICGTLRRCWAVPPNPRFQSGREKASALAEFIAAAFGGAGPALLGSRDRPCDVFCARS